MVMLPTPLIAGMKIAISRNDSRFAFRYWSLTPWKISSLRGSRRNAWTARIPVIDSTKCTMTSTTASRVCR